MAEKRKNKNDPASQYLRIGTDYYKIVHHPLASKDTNEILYKWNKNLIREDHGNILKDIAKYDSACLIPNHVNYQRQVFNSYNTYEPIPHKPKKGDWSTIKMFLEHIFREQYLIGIDYLTILWKHPTQILPILCLVSKERNTGKTTFLLFLKDIFGKNMTFNTNEDFRTNFNSGWSTKILIGVDEVLLDKPEDAEKLKALSTARTINSEAKGKDRIEQEFFGKFILCSNNETGFLKIPHDEIRFWIRKVPSFQTEDINLRKKMIEEIPAFLEFLTNRDITTPNETRMWFTKEQLWTEALKKVMQSGTGLLEKEIREVIIDQFLHFKQNEVFLTPKDIMELLKYENGVFSKKTEIIDVLKQWGYTPINESTYYKRWKYRLNNNGTSSPEEIGCQGRFYTFSKDKFIENK
ncbi:primase-helicase family protein [Draconibacterium sp.]|uniref:primase-helicase family protein n=1 Tax=Draconibacterium sp. TaxID=1965318 RepID=UPI0035685892